MKKWILLSVFMFNSSAFAQDGALAAICADGVTPHPKWPGYWHLDRPQFARTQNAFYATMHLRPNSEGEYAVVKFDSTQSTALTEIARFKDPIRDLEFHDGELWVLFRNKIISLRESDGVRTNEVMTTWDSSLSEHEVAHAFAWNGEKLVIAHGTKGMMIYDAKAKSITQAHSLGLASGPY